MPPRDLATLEVQTIGHCATWVARYGPSFEQLLRDKHQPHGGEGLEWGFLWPSSVGQPNAEYYNRMLSYQRAELSANAQPDEADILGSPATSERIVLGAVARARVLARPAGAVAGYVADEHVAELQLRHEEKYQHEKKFAHTRLDSFCVSLRDAAYDSGGLDFFQVFMQHSSEDCSTTGRPCIKLAEFEEARQLAPAPAPAPEQPPLARAFAVPQHLLERAPGAPGE